MFARIILESVARNPRRKMLASAVLILATAAAAATLTVALDEGDRLAHEFGSFGANILVTPQADSLPLQIGGIDSRPVTQGSYLPVADLGRLKTIFWRNNVVGFTPFLEVPVTIETPGGAVETTLVGAWFRHAVAVAGQPPFVTGLEATNPWWHAEGNWFREGIAECVVGRTLAERLGIRPGRMLEVSAGTAQVALRVAGIVSTGESEDGALVGPLSLAQQLAGKPGKYRRLLVTAFTKPEDDFARQDPNRMSGDQYERWYCSPYAGSITLQVQQALPGSRAQVVRRVAESEGRILSRVSALFWLITLGALAAAGLAIAAMAAASIIERRSEVALMKALGASSSLLAGFFLAEQLAVALASGVVGFGLGTLLARGLGRLVFGVASPPQLVLLPVVLALAAMVAAAGSLVPLRRVTGFDPAPILRGE
ncbi:MAG TPA: ABC transporter permease [Candidatus Acidoferrales bacterium]|nr:ABC transporter permease [Candidatus Acidoferrales bacterium]